MAQRRMFSPDIVENDVFLDMPVSSQALYFHLGMYADDDGFVAPRRVMRIAGASDDDLKILIAKGFVLPFESGVIVIKHWKVNNLVRKDWYRETRFLAEKQTLTVEANGTYTSFVNENAPIRQHRLGKVRLGNKDTKKTIFLTPSIANGETKNPAARDFTPEEAAFMFSELTKQSIKERNQR